MPDLSLQPSAPQAGVTELTRSLFSNFTQTARGEILPSTIGLHDKHKRR